VIEQTTRQKLPPGFQTAEFLLEHGMVDRVVTRKELRQTVATLLRFYRLAWAQAHPVKAVPDSTKLTPTPAETPFRRNWVVTIPSACPM
jgi:hypothetical protein